MKRADRKKEESVSEEMTKDDAIDFFAEFYGGEHHLPAGTRGLATFDFNKLTQLVFLAHDRCFRVSIENSGPKMVKIAIWKRRRDGKMFERHPTLEEAVAEWRKRHHGTKRQEGASE